MLKGEPMLLAPPASRVLTVGEVKAHSRISTDAEDSLIEGLIATAEGHLDGYYGRLGQAMIAQTWRQTFERFPYGRQLPIPLGRVLSVTSVTYFDAMGFEQTLSADTYQAISGVGGPVLSLRFEQVWPDTARRPDAVTVTWECGFGSLASDVPEPIRQALKMLVAHWYENREATAIAVPISSMPIAVDALIRPHQRTRHAARW